MNTNDAIEKNSRLLAGKLIVLAVLVGVSWVATLFVWGVLEDREQRQETTSFEVAEQWSRAQLIAGPVLTIPIEKTSVSTTGEVFVESDTLVLMPQDLSYTSTIQTEVRTKGVYDTPVYTANIDGVGSFELTPLKDVISKNTTILWDKATVSINVSDTRGISSAMELSFNGTRYPLSPSSDFWIFDAQGVHAKTPIDPTQSTHTFAFTLQLKGSREMSFLPLGERTEVTMQSDWNAPNFIGQFLPEERTLSENGFSAHWNIASFGTNIPRTWTEHAGRMHTESLMSMTFGVGLYQEVGFYTMVNRAVKYSILFISLTFLTFFMYEVLAGLRIHPMQYLLVGLSIALFYLLLLSFAELIGFLPAYLLSTLAITGLITGYCVSVLKKKKRAFSITALLLALYGYLYILLQLEELSLVFGSVFLFGVLAIVMYITRKLDWYSLKKTT